MKNNTLHSSVHAVWQRSQKLHLMAGLLSFCRWGTGLFLVAILIDTLLHLPPAGRFVLLLVWVVVTFTKAWRQGWSKCERFNPVHTALQVEEHFGNLNSLLVTAIQFREQEKAKGAFDSMHEMTCKQAEESISPLPMKETVSFNILGRPTMIAFMFAAAIVIFAAVNSAHLLAGLNRFFTPWVSMAYPTDTQINLGEGNIVVKEGQGLSIEAALAGIIPEKAQLALRTGDGEPRIHQLSVADASCEYKIKSTFRSFQYRVSAGDAESPWHTVTVISAPRVIEAKNLLTFPKYTLKAVETSEALTLTVPEGTTITWQLKLDRAIKEGFFNCEEQEPIPLKISTDGLSVSVEHKALSSRAYSFSWVEKDHGYDFKSPRHYLQVMPDQPPHVELMSPRQNLMATLKRQLSIAYNVRDDHGIAESTLSYRVNGLEELQKTLPALPKQENNRVTFDWDYHKLITDLKIGDKISFAINISDRYPGPDGANKARSEVRSITFLSEADYLTYVLKLKKRLLSQLRTLYRQEREAYYVVDNFDFTDYSFEQSCSLEAVRQDIISERIVFITTEIANMVSDLTANHVTGDGQIKTLEELSLGLQAISTKYIIPAAGGLRNLADAGNKQRLGRPEVLRDVNNAAREISSLVLKLGINFALEVFSRELQAAIQNQTVLRLDVMDLSSDDTKSFRTLSEKQSEQGAWMARLLDELISEQDYENRPLAGVRLSRVSEQLRRSGIAKHMQSAAKFISEGKIAEAAKVQKTIISLLSKAQYSIQPSTELKDLVKARDLLMTVQNRQTELSQEKGASPTDMSQKQLSLMTKLRSLVIPYIPAIKTTLMDPNPNYPPAIETKTSALRTAILNSSEEFKASKLAEAAKQQAQVDTSLTDLISIVKKRLAEKMMFGKTYSLLMKADGRATVVAELEVRQLGVIEQTEDADADELPSAPLVPRQESLATELRAFQKFIVEQNKDPDQVSQYIPALQNLLEKSLRSMKEVIPELKANEPGSAIDVQEEVLDALGQAKTLAKQETTSLTGLMTVMAVAQSVMVPLKYIKDIETVQLDLIAATKKANAKNSALLVAAQNRLSLATYDTALALAGILETVDLEQSFTFAGSELGAATLLLKDGKPQEAIEHQLEAVVFLKDIRKALEKFASQNEYLAEVMEFLQQSMGDGNTLLYTQTKLSEQIWFKKKTLEETKAPQKELIVGVKKFGAMLFKATNKKHYSSAADDMQEIVELLGKDSRSDVIDAMEVAEDELSADIQELNATIIRLALVPEVLVVEASPELLALLEALDIAVEQRNLCNNMWLATDKEKALLATRQNDIEERMIDVMQMSKNHEVIKMAREQMNKAIVEMKAADWKKAYSSQRLAGNYLRRFILEYALRYIRVKGPAMKKKSNKFGKGVAHLIQTDDLKLFTKVAVSGDTPKDGRAEWEVLGSRDRAALNENFARELPLEYRDLLKDYYERLAK